MGLSIIAAFVVLAAAPLSPDHPPVTLALKPANAHGARYHNGVVSLMGMVDLADAGQNAQDQARTYFGALLGSEVELTPVGVDHTSRGTVVHFKQALNGVPIEGTYAMAVINHAVLHYASLRLIQAPKTLRTAPSVDAAAAAGIATTTLQPETLTLDREPTLSVAFDDHGTPTLVWRVMVRSDGAAAGWNAYVDAHSGALLGGKRSPSNGVQVANTP